MPWDDKRPIEHFQRMTPEDWDHVEGDLGYIGLADYVAFLKKRSLATMTEEQLREIESRHNAGPSKDLAEEIAAAAKAHGDRGRLLHELREQIR